MCPILFGFQIVSIRGTLTSDTRMRTLPRSDTNSQAKELQRHCSDRRAGPMNQDHAGLFGWLHGGSRQHQTLVNCHPQCAKPCRAETNSLSEHVGRELERKLGLGYGVLGERPGLRPTRIGSVDSSAHPVADFEGRNVGSQSNNDSSEIASVDCARARESFIHFVVAWVDCHNLHLHQELVGSRLRHGYILIDP